MRRAAATAWLLAGALLGGGCSARDSARADANETSWQEQAVLTWAQKLDDPDPWVRVSAVTALGELGEEGRSATGLLLRLLQGDADAEVRARAARALASIGAQDAAGPLLDALASDESKVARAAAGALVRLGRGREVLELALTRFDEHPPLSELNDLAHHLAAVGEPAVAPLRTRLLSNGAVETRRAAALCLGQVGEPARVAVPEIESLLLEPDTHTRLAAVLALAQIGGPEACRALARTAAEDPDAGIQLEALLNGGVPCNFQPAEEPEAEEP